MPDARQQRPDSGIARPKRTLSLRVRLMILAVIAVVPLLVERIYNEEFDRSERIETAYKQALGLARQGAAEQNEVIGSARAILQVVASARATFNASNDECNLFLANIAKPVPWIRTLSVADLQGRIFCSSYPELDRPGYFRPSAFSQGGRQRRFRAQRLLRRHPRQGFDHYAGARAARAKWRHRRGRARFARPQLVRARRQDFRPAVRQHDDDRWHRHRACALSDPPGVCRPGIQGPPVDSSHAVAPRRPRHRDRA